MTHDKRDRCLDGRFDDKIIKVPPYLPKVTSLAHLTARRLLRL